MTTYILLGIISLVAAALLALPVYTSRLPARKKIIASLLIAIFICGGSMGLYSLLGTPGLVEFLREWGE
jgi:hypothetical protein